MPNSKALYHHIRSVHRHVFFPSSGNRASDPPRQVGTAERIRDCWATWSSRSLPPATVTHSKRMLPWCSRASARCRHRKLETRYDPGAAGICGRQTGRGLGAVSYSSAQLSSNPRAVSFPVGASWKPGTGTRVPPKRTAGWDGHRGRCACGRWPVAPGLDNESSRLSC